MMKSQFSCCTETLWTFTANIRLHSFMTSKWMLLQINKCNELLLTNVTCEPSTFIVWLQNAENSTHKINENTTTKTRNLTREESVCFSLPWKHGLHQNLVSLYCCLGKDPDGEKDRFKLLSFQRLEDVKEAALSTFCTRRRWINADMPLLADILREYPKFQSNPQLVFV